MGYATDRVGQRSENWDKTTLVWMGRRAFGRRGHRILAIGGAALLLLSAGLFSVHAYATATVRSHAISAIETKLGRGVVVGDVDIGFSAISLGAVSIEGLGTIERVVASYDFSSALVGDIEVGRIDVYGVAFEVEREANGDTSVDDVVARLKARASLKTGVSADEGEADTPIALHDVRIRLVDAKTSTDISIHAAHLTPDRSTRDLAIIDAGFEGSSQHPRLRRFLANNAAEGVGGIVSYASRTLRFDLEGSLADSSAERYSIAGTVDIESRTAELAIETTNVALGRAVLGLGVLRDVDQTRVDSKLAATLSLEKAIVRGQASLSKLSFAHRRVAADPVENVDVTLSGAIELDRALKSIRVVDGLVRSAGIDYAVTASGQLADLDRSEHPEASLSATLKVAKKPCNEILGSIPAGLVPDLQGFVLEGEMAAQVELAIDWADLKKTRFSSDVLDEGGINNCRVVSAPERVSAERLRGSFEHTVPVGDSTMTFTVGPESENYVPLSKVSRHLTRSLMTTEDSRFYRHNGFITKEFRTALVKNLEKGRFAYGASSISMQVVKNVMLARTKTVSRKLEELFLTWYLENELDKDRILEIYVNAIEFGPGIYGIKPAAKRYFNKHPRRLNPVESAFFSSILPSPVRRFKQYCRGWAGRWTKGKIDRILDIMLERNRLDEEQYWTAIGTPLIFRGSRKDICHDYNNGLIGSVKKGTSL